MKGVIFNAVQDSVERVLGPDAWDETLDRAEVTSSSLATTPMRTLRDYRRASRSDRDTIDRLRWLDHQSVPCSAFPDFFAGADLRAFLPALNHMIHPEVRKLYPGATPPDFEIGEGRSGTLTLRYDSERRLCWLAEGLTLGVAAHLGESIRIEQTSCMHDNADHCDLLITFT